jgi:phosphoglycolate phosphatase-like HAD superfamily hydrolase
MLNSQIQNTALNFLRSFDLVIWDFDGVIKDSVAVKGDIYANLFPHATSLVRRQILNHHYMNGGLSRHEKIPLYMGWCGIPVTSTNIQEFLVAFSRQSVVQVVNSPWIPGVKEYLRSNIIKQRFYVVSATPLCELNQIIEKLKIDNCFVGTYGSPCPKKVAITKILDQEKAIPSDAVFVGDSQLDYEAASACGVPFFLRGEANIKIASTHNLANFL